MRSSSATARTATLRPNGILQIEQPRPQRLNPTDRGVRDIPGLDIANESLQPFVGDVRLGSYRANGEISGIADAFEQSDGVVEEVHASDYGETFPHQSSATFPTAQFMLLSMARRPSYDLPTAFRENLKAAIEYLKQKRGLTDEKDMSGRRLADALGVEPRTLRETLSGANVPNLRTVQRFVERLHLEPWQVCVKGLRPGRLPVLRKKGAGTMLPEDRLTDLLLESWGRLTDDRQRIEALHAVQRIETTTEAWATVPPDPLDAPQALR